MMSIVAAASAWATTVALASTAITVVHDPGRLTVDEALGVLVLGVGTLTGAWTASWATAGGIALVAAGLRGTTAPVERLIARPTTPRLLRRGLAAALGLTLAVGASPALASPGSSDPADLGWDAAVARAAGSAASDPSAPSEVAVAVAVDQAHPEQAGAASAPPATLEPHVVTPGESLWSIAAHHLGEGASPAEIASAWPRWYDANRAAVGAEPDYITPGLLLTPPADTPISGG